jgi:N-methylhydantoinase B/oxoprolinase/acetone carboxylase alpha subunit
MTSGTRPTGLCGGLASGARQRCQTRARPVVDMESSAQVRDGQEDQQWLAVLTLGGGFGDAMLGLGSSSVRIDLVGSRPEPEMSTVRCHPTRP